MKTAYPFRFGTVFIEYEQDLLVSLICSPEPYEITEQDRNTRSEFTDSVMKQVNEFLDGTRTSFDLNYELSGTEFQKKVWNALLRIPYGETRTYKQIAEKIGNPAACRAVGMANNKNRLHLIIPCHRVIGADGSLTGYAGGLEMKRCVLEKEREKRPV